MEHEICPQCNGSGLIYDKSAGDFVDCPTCDGNGFIDKEDDEQ